MDLTTPVRFQSLRAPLALANSFVALGSCFADRIGEKLDRHFFRCTVNPVGVLYNPVSLSNALNPEPNAPNLLLHQGTWRCLRHHSRFTHKNPRRALELIRQAEIQRCESLSAAKVMLLTLGTATVFRSQSDGSVVTNCHRLPQSMFSRCRLTVAESVEALRSPLETWLDQDAERRVILTVSPVRYLRPSLVENSRGKATLLLATEELCRLHKRIHYFPAYEILLDELRDYRFFDDHMTQPSSKAVDFVWTRFQDFAFSEEQREHLNTAQKLALLLEHRIGPETDLGAMSSKARKLLERLDLAGLNLEMPRARLAEWESAREKKASSY